MANIASAAADMWAEWENAPPPGRVKGQVTGLGTEELDDLVSGIDLSPLGEEEIALASRVDRSRT